MKKLTIAISLIILAIVSGQALGQAYKRNATRAFLPNSGEVRGFRAFITNRDPSLRLGQLVLHRIILTKYATPSSTERFLEFGWIKGLPALYLPYESKELIVIYGEPNFTSSFILSNVVANDFVYEIRHHPNVNNSEPLCPLGGPFHSINFKTLPTTYVLTKICLDKTLIDVADQAMWGGEIITSNLSLNVMPDMVGSYGTLRATNAYTDLERFHNSEWRPVKQNIYFHHDDSPYNVRGVISNSSTYTDWFEICGVENGTFPAALYSSGIAGVASNQQCILPIPPSP